MTVGGYNTTQPTYKECPMTTTDTNILGEVEETTITQLNSLRQAAKDL